MKFLYASLLFIAVSCLLPLASRAQCPDCIPDENCVSSDGFPALCPMVPDDATAGTYYEEQLTFFMPALITDPGTGIEATLVSVTVASVSGMPYGLEFTINDADGVFYPSAGDGLGCATICGVPLLPGTYNIVITVNAILNVFGFETSQSQAFTLTLSVVPGEGSANSFSYDNIAGCGSVDVNYEALISVPAPSVTTYAWDFGNGAIGDGVNPSTVNYAAPGNYTAVLTTTVSDYKITAVSVNSLNDNWSGDFDDLISEADVYFLIYDANNATVYTSGTNDNVTSTSWNVPSITLSNPPYSIQFFDEDDISDDDDLGTHNFPLSAGENFFDVQNGTTGFVTITLETTTEIVDSATISVFPAPQPTISLNGNSLLLVAEDIATVTWYRNDIAIDGEVSETLALTEGGQYYAEIFNSFGCSAISNEILYCAPVEIEFDQIAGELSVPDVFETYQWYFNGLELDGGNSAYIISAGPGNYMVEVTTDYGCSTESEVFILEVNLNEVSQTTSAVYPNPASEQISFVCPVCSDNFQFVIHDILGKQMPVSLISRSGSSINIDVSSYPEGIYFTTIGNQNIRWIKK